MKLAKVCPDCGTSFENWVTGKIMAHIGNHHDDKQGGK